MTIGELRDKLKRLKRLEKELEATQATYKLELFLGDPDPSFFRDKIAGLKNEIAGIVFSEINIKEPDKYVLDEL